MCTVSFVPLPNGFVFHSNRDEKSFRPTISPQIYVENGAKLIYPKDEQAGGTWIVAKEDGTCIILLNGAFENHQKLAVYRKSRGQILKEIILETNPLDAFFEMNLNEIEPFTLIVFYKNTLTEARWDGNNKHRLSKSLEQNHIWSSATLYNHAQRKARAQWFDDFCSTHQPLTIEKIFSFHSETKKDNKEYGLVIEREDQTKTVSITQIRIENNQIEMVYTDKINPLCATKIGFCI